MKLQKDQINALANHVLSEISKKNKVVLTAIEKKEIDEFLKAGKEHSAKVEKLNEEYDNISKKFHKKYSLNYNFHYGDTPEHVYNYIIRSKDKNPPSITEIKNAIIMQSLFSSEADLKKFIKDLVAKY